MEEISQNFVAFSEYMNFIQVNPSTIYDKVVPHKLADLFMFEQNNVLWLSHIFRSSNHETENGFDDRESSMNTPSHHTNNLHTNNVSWVTDS